MSLVILFLHLGDGLIKTLDPGLFHLLIFFAASGLGLLVIHHFLLFSDLFDLLHGHTHSAADVLSLVADLVDLIPALLQSLGLFVIGALQHMVLGLVLLFETAQVLVAHDLVEEGLELPLDVLKGLWVEAKLVNLLEFLCFVGDGANV